MALRCVPSHDSFVKAMQHAHINQAQNMMECGTTCNSLTLHALYIIFQLCLHAHTCIQHCMQRRTHTHKHKQAHTHKHKPHKPTDPSIHPARQPASQPCIQYIIHPYIHTLLHPPILPYAGPYIIYPYTHACIHTHARTYPQNIRLYVHAYVHTCIPKLGAAGPNGGQVDFKSGCNLEQVWRAKQQDSC